MLRLISPGRCPTGALGRALPVELVSALLNFPATRSFSSAPHVFDAQSKPTAPRFTYHHATSFFPKPESAIAKTFTGFPPNHPIRAWVENRVQRETEGKWGAGEDFWFMIDRQSSHASGLTLGIADGVGGWQDSGIDPSMYSQALMYYVERAVGLRTDPNGLLASDDGFLREVLREAGKFVIKDVAVPAGSSTALLLNFAPSGQLSGLNLGDSTFFLLRQGKIVHMQPSQTFAFNAPFQLSKFPGGKPSAGSYINTADHADRFEDQLQNDDVVVACTDGFSDNVWPSELEQMWKLVGDFKGLAGPQDRVTKFATAAVNYARACSYRVDKKSPFEADAMAHGIKDMKGGKVDDCTVIAVWARQEHGVDEQTK